MPADKSREGIFL